MVAPLLGGILGVARIVLRDVFLASIFLAYVEPKLLFLLMRRKILQCSPYHRRGKQHRHGGFVCGNSCVQVDGTDLI